MFTRTTNTSSQASTQVDTTAALDLQQIENSSAHQGELLQPVIKDVRPNESGQPVSGQSTGSGTLPTLYPNPHLQRTTPLMTREGSAEIGRIDSHLTSPSHPPTIKRKYPDPGSLSEQCKRLRDRVNLDDLNIPDGMYGTRSDDTFTATANNIKEQGLDKNVVRDDRTDMVDRNASELFFRASGLHPQPPSRNQFASSFGPIAISTKITASHE
jgi:hypothetical protein